MTGQIVGVVRQGDRVTASVLVNDGDGTGPREYVATVPAVDALGQALTPAQIKQLLVAAWQAQRAARPQPAQDLSGQITGTVNV